MEAMINNKQVNLWRGDAEPPTIYHIWIKDNSKLLLFNGQEWVVFLDNLEFIETLNQLLEQISTIQSSIIDLGNKTVNNKAIKDNPILYGNDITINDSGSFITSDSTLTKAILKLDSLLTTQIIQE